MQSNVASMQNELGSPQPVPWDDVRLFLALLRSRTLGAAGKQLGVDGSTMSRRLGTLEGTLGTILFERSRSGIVATEAAQRLTAAAEEMEHAMARFTGSVESLERNVSGQVRLACPGDAAAILIAPLLPELLRQHPHLQIDLAAGEGVVDMTRREADLALRTVRPTVGDLVVTRLFSVRWAVAAAPSVVHNTKPLRKWAELPWVGCGTRLAGSTPGRWFRDTLGSIEPVLRADSLTTQLACVGAGVGVALLPERSIKPSGLVPVKLSRSLQASTEPWPEDDMFLVTHRSLRRVPRVRAVWEFLLNRAAKRSGEAERKKRRT